MHRSPIKTTLKNLKNTRISLRIDGATVVTLLPAGESGDTVSVIGDVFSRDYKSSVDHSIVHALRAGSIAVGYTVDHTFPVTVERTTPNLVNKDQTLRNWYLQYFKDAVPAKNCTQPKDGQGGEVRQASGSRTAETPVKPTKTPESSKAESSLTAAETQKQTHEPAQASKPTSADKVQATPDQEVQTESNKPADSVPGNPKEAPAKAARRIKIK